LKAYRTVVRLADRTAEVAERERPHAVILIDSWGFTCAWRSGSAAGHPTPCW
jgi:lipid-A-disaccharide synthase